MVARFTNLSPFPPLGWQRGLIGIVLGAAPHAFEGLLGFLIDVADGDAHYRSKYVQRFKERHQGGFNCCNSCSSCASLAPLMQLHMLQPVGLEPLSTVCWPCSEAVLQQQEQRQEGAPGSSAAAASAALSSSAAG
jgi:hypothetical protein